jgi:aspartyl aminopeptidase
MMQVGVELYGGGLWHTWFDRDLSVAGRVLVQKADGKLEHTLVRINRPILRIPNLAIHLSTERNTFTINKETHLQPILGQVVSDELNKEDKSSHHPVLLALIAKEMGVRVDAIRDFELCLYDCQAPAVGGVANEFVHSARLDNLGMSYMALMALINSSGLEKEEGIRMTAFFDNEEVGSVSAHGADSNLLESAIRRIGALPIGVEATSAV